jgi:hypothetical protein
MNKIKIKINKKKRMSGERLQRRHVGKMQVQVSSLEKRVLPQKIPPRNQNHIDGLGV